MKTAKTVNKMTTMKIRNRASNMQRGQTIIINEPYNTSRHATICTSLRRSSDTRSYSVTKFNNKFKITRVR